MRSEILKWNNETAKKAKDIIQRWDIVAFPTETIYWLGADALNTTAVKKIFEAKGRPSSNPLIVHIWKKEQINGLWIIENKYQQQIVDKLFPWPITLLLKKEDCIPEVVTQNPYVWIRMPSNTIANEFLIAVEAPIAAPSANISWKPSPTSAPMVADNVWDKIDLIIDWWNSDYGIESTVVKVDEENWKWKIWILRPWFITKEDLEEFFKWQDVEVEYTSKDKNMSPWTRFKHYSIPWEIIIIENIREIKDSTEEKIAIIATKEWIDKENINTIKNENKLILERWTENNLASCAHNLFELYHKCETLGIKKVYIQRLPENWLWFAIMNRVKRSAEK